MLGKRVERRRHGPVFGREVGHAQLAGGEGLQNRDLLHGRFARLEGGGARRKTHPTHVDFFGGGLFQTPAVTAAHHARDPARRREEAHAARKRRQVALREEFGTARPVGVEEGPAHHALDRLHLRRNARKGKLVAREEVRLALVGFAHVDHEPHGPPAAEGHDHRAAHGDVVHAFGHGVGVGLVESLGGYVQNDARDVHGNQCNRLRGRRRACESQAQRSPRSAPASAGGRAGRQRCQAQRPRPGGRRF